MNDEEEHLLKEISTTESEIEKLERERIKIVRRLQTLKEKAEGLKTKYNSLKTKQASNINWAEQTGQWEEKINEILKTKFKLEKFRHQQLAAINAVLSKKDVILLMPTGGGKSLCYQLPALVTKGITLVVSPLLSLIDDQIIALNNLGISATALNSSNSKTEGKRVFDALATGKSDMKLIYVTPEWLAKSKRFMSYLQKCYERKGLDRIAIDEVHCCSQWGHDFRPDYKFLGILKNVFPDAPIIGLTATATEGIILDVQTMLNIEGCVVLKASFNRPNLFYVVKEKPPNKDDCATLLMKMVTEKYRNKSGIIYTTTINDSVELATDLKSRGLSVACYHANMETDIRQKVHKKWLSNTYQVIVATVAFGMGIDKPDVRFVIHHSIPKSVENFYQESGRAGRDDKRADCVVLYSLKDVFRMSSMVATTRKGLNRNFFLHLCSLLAVHCSLARKGSDNLYRLIDYCLDSTRCRRSIISSYFDEVWDAKQCNKMCDHCEIPRQEKVVDITKYYKEMLDLIKKSAMSDTKLTAIKLLDAWFKTNKPSISRVMAENILAFLLCNGYLKEDIHFTPYNTISYMKQGLPLQADSKIKMTIAGSAQQLNEENLSLKRNNTDSSSSEHKKKKNNH